ncbi:tryptophanyl-tRNA synthetase [Algoriphagus ornithinivorans]|jgi:tryptophanyl-tRNA synthetase|uniref:Tryptophan--tRNA ligase n=2 Tax=Algoriphagus TaxID=246875 RepID=A0A1I5GYB9_9BACT|nr:MULTISPECIES: tryptophan--tRNA ligase [Algoriphagus]MAL14963.1 tryptophan--tRNA ligase [Algoriphagus sp.]MAN86371.1 tryptophan--tRNA ligase [Algoriphagus sp.]QYH38366.1 tryptophan--tRNA ligase [Algoriphagus sp. NBT04N3]SFO40953.1 tryptophanyl-tRNA synthetase [Algoriphagus ornithinivorans]HAD50387.1 tryptophan--tRNA ligase [Algoriphagus sp.]|tara:strand:- start:126 stop:1100 length:975 start_codon:yes stop_codon:yes gene_type:complete
MARVLTGIQSSGRPHLGNILGAIVPAIQLAKENQEESYIFIADFHSLTSSKDSELRKQNTLAVAAAWLAFGLDISKTVFYRQSRRPEVAELTWYLNCFTPFPMLANAHSFKDKSERLADVNAGLFTYPVLMAADILLYSADLVPVGKDQMQHLEMTRDIASTFNRIIGEDLLTIPEARISESVKTIPGTDGQKMSKSYNNYIDIFLPEKQLKKVVNTIVTDSTPLEEPKDPDTCNVYKLYSLIASETQTQEMRAKYQGGNYGYGHAKKEFFELILTKYAEERKAFDFYMSNPKEIEEKLAAGEEKARQVGEKLLNQVREKLGFR